MSKGEKIPYEDAMKIAKIHLIGIAELERTEKVAIVGSLRRREKEVGDIDFQIIGNHGDIRYYLGDNDWWLGRGGGKRQIFTPGATDIKINCFYTEASHWGAALMHNTGPSRYNIRKRAMIKKKGGVLNQYGLYMPPESEYVEDDYEYIAGETEQDIYDALDWSYCKPEDRE